MEAVEGWGEERVRSKMRRRCGKMLGESILFLDL